MAENQFETVAYTKIRHIHVFLNHILYRNFHLHSETELLCVLGGTCTINLVNGPVGASRGSILLFNPQEAHEITSSGGADFVILQFSRHLFEPYFPALQSTVFGGHDLSALCGADTLARLWKAVCALAEAYIREEEGFQLSCIAAAAEIYALLFANVPHTVYSGLDDLSRSKATARMQRLANIIRENEAYGITLAELAARENVTPTHLSHFFAEKFGVTFQEYVANIRFENALRLIANPSLSLAEVAIQSGFSDSKYMTKMFQKRFGCTPKMFRREKMSSLPDHTDRKDAGEFLYDRARSLELIRELAPV